MRLFKNWHIPPRRVVLWHAISALPLAIVVGLGGYLSYHYRALSIQGREQVDRAYEVLEQVAGLLAAIEDADVAQRDFIISGSPVRLNRFQAALRSIISAQAPLHDRLGDSPPQLQRLARLQVAIAAKTTELGKTVLVRQTEGFEAAKVNLAGDDDKLMDQVRVQAAGLLAAERQLLLDRQRATRQHERNVLLAGAAIAMASVVVRLLTAWLLARLRRKATSEPAP